MKRIIDGRMYNTETATRVGYYGNGYSYTDFRVIEEYLYIKRTGEWFFLWFWRCNDGVCSNM